VRTTPERITARKLFDGTVFPRRYS
jgi:hypothetical protein